MAVSATIVSAMVASVVLGPAGDQVLARDGYSNRDHYASTTLVPSDAPALRTPFAAPRMRDERSGSWTAMRRTVGWDRVARLKPRRSDAPAVRAAAWSPASGSFATHTVCVRLCDGYHFPVGEAHATGDIDTQTAVCSSTCPGAPTRLYTLPSADSDIGEAIAVTNGQLYTELPVAYAHTTEVGPTCTCHREGEQQASLMAPLNDITMRKGDSVMTPVGWRVFRGSDHWPYQRTDFSDLSSMPNLPRKTRSTLIAIENVSVNHAAAQRGRAADLKIRLGSSAPTRTDDRNGTLSSVY